jgi:uncharacterized protein YeeX (DUF496 family)
MKTYNSKWIEDYIKKQEKIKKEKEEFEKKVKEFEIKKNYLT